MRHVPSLVPSCRTTCAQTWSGGLRQALLCRRAFALAGLSPCLLTLLYSFLGCPSRLSPAHLLGSACPRGWWFCSHCPRCPDKTVTGDLMLMGTSRGCHLHKMTQAQGENARVLASGLTTPGFDSRFKEPVAWVCSQQGTRLRYSREIC